MDQTLINLAVGLGLLIAANIFLGSLDALFAKTFDYSTLFTGILKAAVVLVCLAAIYYAGYLNPDIVALTIDGQEMNVLSALNVVVLGAYYIYARQVFEKLIALFKTKTSLTESDTENTPTQEEN